MAAHQKRERVRIKLLGPFRARVDGAEVADPAWPGRRSAELVQLLALADRHRLMRPHQVIEALWPHLGPEAGAANLRKAAHHARLALRSQDAVVLRGGGVALFPSSQVETDVESFERMAQAAVRSRDRVACAEAAAAYTGVLLPESLYEEWTQARRDHLRALHVELLRVRARWGRLGNAEPTDEPAYRERIRAALASGNRHAAIRWYGRLRTNLERELGMPPSLASQALYEECVAGLGVTGTTFVGRQVELARASVALRSAEQGEVGALVVRGPAGIGKSALCRQFATVARKRAWQVVSVAASFGGSPYAPLVNAVEQLLSRDHTLLDALSDHARSTLAELTLLAAPARPHEGGLTRHMVIGAVQRLIMACRDGTGVMLVLDDAHLADDATVEACVHLARARGGPPFLAVLAYRPEVARRTLMRGLAGLDGAGRSVGIDLPPLDRDEVIALAEAGAPTKPDAGVLAQIVAMAQGNPFFALELARGIVADKPLAIPSTVWAAVTARFLDLDDARAGKLRWLAVAADDLDPSGVLDGLRPDEATEWLLAAARRAITLGAFADGLGHLEPLLDHAPKHTEARRLRAEVLDALGDGRAPEAYAAAAEIVGEPECHELRAQQALAQIKLGDPTGALKTLDGATPTTTRGQLSHALALSGAAAMGFGDPGLATTKAAESRRLALRLRDAGALVEASWAQALAAHSRGDLQGSLRADLRETHALPELAVRVFDGQLCVTQRLLYGAMPYAEVVAFADSLALEADRLGAARGHAFAVTLRGEAKLLSGELHEADDDLAAGARLNRAIGAAAGEAFALQRRAEVALQRGRSAEAAALLEDALAVARESDVGFHLLDRIYGTRVAAAADPPAALAALEEAESAVRGPLETCPGCRVTLAVPAAIAAARGGDLDRAQRYAQDAETLAAVVMRLPGWDAAVEEVKGHLALATEDVVAAAAHFGTAADGFRESGQPLDEARCAALANRSG